MGYIHRVRSRAAENGGRTKFFSIVIVVIPVVIPIIVPIVIVVILPVIIIRVVIILPF